MNRNENDELYEYERPVHEAGRLSSFGYTAVGVLVAAGMLGGTAFALNAATPKPATSQVQTQLTDVVDPTAPVDPAAPVDPTIPVDPTTPIDPVAPVDPGTDSNTVTPPVDVINPPAFTGGDDDDDDDDDDDGDDDGDHDGADDDDDDGHDEDHEDED